MDFVANEEKKVEIETSTGVYLRHAIQTHFVGVGESYIDLMEKYVKPVYEEGDIISASEKVIALCQKRIVTEEECKPGFWAKFLCRFVHQTAAGPGMGLPVKMQFAINTCGVGKVIWAAICAGFGKLVGKKGVFYKMLGDEVYGLDGFYGRDIPEYEHMGVRIPENPGGVCDEIFDKCGIKMMIVDASDLEVDLLGKCKALGDYTDAQLLEMIADNPAGQDRQLTPFILIRKKAE